MIRARVKLPKLLTHSYLLFPNYWAKQIQHLFVYLKRSNYLFVCIFLLLISMRLWWFIVYISIWWSIWFTYQNYRYVLNNLFNELIVLMTHEHFCIIIQIIRLINLSLIFFGTRICCRYLKAWWIFNVGCTLVYDHLLALNTLK